VSDGARIGTLINFAAHTTAIGSSNRELSSDWVHFTRVTAEARLGAPVIFSNGAIGDVSPQPSGDGDQFDRANKYGSDIANLAVDSISSQVSSPFLLLHCTGMRDLYASSFADSC